MWGQGALNTEDGWKPCPSARQWLPHSVRPDGCPHPPHPRPRKRCALGQVTFQASVATTESDCWLGALLKYPSQMLPLELASALPYL